MSIGARAFQASVCLALLVGVVSSALAQVPDGAAIFLLRHDPARTPEMRVLLSSF